MDRLGSRTNPRLIVPRNRNQESGKPMVVPEPWYPRFGDWIGIVLANIPILRLTPQRWREIKVAYGFTDACNCPERKIKLNIFGRRIARPLWTAARWLFRWFPPLRIKAPGKAPNPSPNATQAPGASQLPLEPRKPL